MRIAGGQRALGHPGERARELAFHETLISYIDNRYLEKIYQQFLDGYIGYVILYLKEDNQESAQILSSLMEAIRQGDRAEIAQETQRYFLSGRNNASTHEGLGKCRSLD